MHYEDGDIAHWDNCDLDKWNMFELKNGLEELGYKKIMI